MFTNIVHQKSFFVFHFSSEFNASPQIKQPAESLKIQAIPKDFPKDDFLIKFNQWQDSSWLNNENKAQQLKDLLDICKNAWVTIHPFLSTPERMIAFGQLLKAKIATNVMTAKWLAHVYPKYILTKEELAKSLFDIKAYDVSLLVWELTKYEKSRFNIKFSQNSFELIALYQSALKQLNYLTPNDLDWQFWDKTLLAIQEFQSHHTMDIIDGFPGPKTTQALIKELQNREKNPVIPRSPETLAPPTQITTTPEPTVEKKRTILDVAGQYLSSRWYKQIVGTQDGLRYRNPDGDLMIHIAPDGTVTPKRSSSRLFGEWGYSNEEKVVVMGLIKHIADFRRNNL